MIFLNMNTDAQKNSTQKYTAPSPSESKRLLRKVWGNLQKLDRQDKGISNEYIHGGNQKTSIEYMDKKTGGVNQ
jgi:hypothetical protein